MDKVVLVIDKCESCPYHRDEKDEHDRLVDICDKLNRTIDGYVRRYQDCPLKPPPKKQELTFHEPGQDAITMGWNACIEEIEGNLK